MHAEVPASSGLVVPKVGAPMPEGKRPDWFHVPAPGGPDSRYSAVKESVRELKLATVCEEVSSEPFRCEMIRRRVWVGRNGKDTK